MFFKRIVSIPVNRHSRLISMSSHCLTKRDPSSSMVSKYELDASSIHSRVLILIKLCNLDAAAGHARLAVLATGEAKVTAKTCVAIIDAMRRDRRYSEAYDLFNYFAAKSNSYLIPNACSDPIIIAFCDEGKIEEALGLYKRSWHNGNRSSAQLALAQGLVDAGRIDEAIDMFYCIDRSLYDIFIRGFLSMGNLERANKLFQVLKSSDYRDALAKVNATFVEHWFKQGMDEKAMECYMSMSSGFNNIHVTAGNNLLKVLFRYGKKTEALLLFSQMMEPKRFTLLDDIKYKTFDSESCNIMVNECFKVGEIGEAMEIFNKVVGLITNPQVCYRNMITRFCEQGMLSEAERCFEEMCSKQYFAPDVPTYRIMRDAYAKEDRVSDALIIINRTLDACLTYIYKKVSEM